MLKPAYATVQINMFLLLLILKEKDFVPKSSRQTGTVVHFSVKLSSHVIPATVTTHM